MCSAKVDDDENAPASQAPTAMRAVRRATPLATPRATRGAPLVTRVADS